MVLLHLIKILTYQIQRQFGHLIGNNKLTDKSPIELSWTNNQGLIFEKEISLDDEYLFTVKQKIINKTNNKYDFYSYGQDNKK